MRLREFFSLSVIVCLLGNFVDQYDLFLFGAIRVTSLRSLGLDPAAVLQSGILLLNCQMAGMLIGGIAAGIWGDRRGRTTILFGSIIIYSIANLANAFVTSVPQYAACRFLAGFGLAGEIGACITLILEVLPPAARGYGTMLLMAFGHTAAITGSALANLVSWRTNYLIGGGMGLLIMCLRFQAAEPAMYLKLAESRVARGNFFAILRSPRLLKRYALGILVAIPTWYAFTILVVFAPEITQARGMAGSVSPEHYMPYYFLALVLGDLTGGLFGQWLKTRKWVIAGYIAMIAVTAALYLFSGTLTLARLLGLIAALGFFSAYTVLSFTVAAEQFGTNLRATAATSTPNFVRASAIVFTFAFGQLKGPLGILGAAAWIGAVTLSVAFGAALGLEETYGKDLDYLS